MQSRRNELRALAVTGIFCWFFFFYGLAAFGLLGADEPRYAQVAREMLARGDWVTPSLYGKVWLEKPVLYYWNAMLAYKAFGVSDWAARFPAAVFATGMVVALYFFVRRFRPGAQVDAALMAVTSVAIFGFARGASTDMPLAACFTVAMLVWWAWFETQKKKWLLAFYFFIAAGALAKGPVAPGLAALIIIIFTLIRRDSRMILRMLWLPGILLFLAVAVPWYWLAQARNPQLFQEFFLQHNLERFSTNLYRHPHPFWYYVPILLLGIFPWTVFAIGGFIQSLNKCFNNNDNKKHIHNIFPQLFLAVWALVPLIFFSFSQSKLPGYILPAIPAWILLAADYLFSKRAEHANMNSAVATLQALLIAFVSGIVVLSPHLLIGSIAMIPKAAWISSTVLFTAVLIFILALTRWRGWQILRSATLFLMILLMGFVLKIDAPIINATQSARPVARDLSRFGSSGVPIVAPDVHRSLEYGLAFYRNAPVYTPAEAAAFHRYLVIEAANSPAQWPQAIPAGSFAPQHLRYLLVLKHP